MRRGGMKLRRQGIGKWLRVREGEVDCLLGGSGIVAWGELGVRERSMIPQNFRAHWERLVR